MCYTPSTSINAFFIGLISSFLLYFKSYNSSGPGPSSNPSYLEYKVLALFFGFVSFMQLFDYIFWTNYQNSTNILFTKIATIFNHLQPIVLAFILYKTIGLKSAGLNLTYIYSIVILLYTINIWKSLKYTEVTPESAPSLDWKWNRGNQADIVYILFLLTLIVLLWSNLQNTGKIAAIITLLSFLFFYFKYQIQLSTGRFWCYFAAFAPLIFLFF
jgi:hypothetical protein